MPPISPFPPKLDNFIGDTICDLAWDVGTTNPGECHSTRLISLYRSYPHPGSNIKTNSWFTVGLNKGLVSLISASFQRVSFLTMDMDDIFGSDDPMEESHPGQVRSPNEPSLRPSRSAMSITDESPQTTTATLFRPPQPRRTPASAASNPTAARERVKKFADLLKLTKENQDILQKMYENTLPGEEYLGTLSYLVFACQEGRTGATGPKWIAGRLIRDAFKDQIGEFVLRPDLQAFSKTVAEDHTTMLQSLEVLTFNYLKGLKPEYVDAHCPGDYVAGEACIPGTAMYMFVKENLKNQRSKVRSSLLTNILGVREGSLLKVPAAKSMVIQVARTFLESVRPLEDNEVLPKLGRPTVKRIIFMRYVTAYNYLNHTENKRRCQWTLLDEALADLRARPESDSALYIDKIIRYDRQVFDGKRTWATIKASVTLPAPFVDQVLASVQDQSGSDLIGDDLGGSGNQATGEDFEEE